MSFTLFSVFKSAEDPHIRVIQRNALNAWLRLSPRPEILVFGDVPGVADLCAEFGVRHVPGIPVDEDNHERLDAAYQIAWELGAHDRMLHINADMILPPYFTDLVDCIDAERYLLIGERWDTPVKGELDFSDGWWERLNDLAQRRGASGSVTSMDYFLHQRHAFTLPELSARSWYSDNVIVQQCLLSGIPVLDASRVLRVVHQRHDHAYAGDNAQRAVNAASQRAQAHLVDGVKNLAHATYRLIPGGM